MHSTVGEKSAYSIGIKHLNPMLSPRDVGGMLARDLRDRYGGTIRPYRDASCDWGYCLSLPEMKKPIAKVKGGNGSVVVVVPGRFEKQMLSEMMGMDPNDIGTIT